MFPNRPQASLAYNTTLALLTNDAEGVLERLLGEIVSWEDAHPPQTQWDGFEWHDIHGDPRTLNTLVVRGLLNIRTKSNKYCIYETADRAAIKRALQDFQNLIRPQEEEPEQIPSDLFQIIVGHDETKDLILRSITADKPVPILLHGAIASAKTLFLEELARLPKSTLLLGSNMTRAGLYDKLLNDRDRPRYLLVDEMDKIVDEDVLSAFLSLMERGLITETKYRRHRQIRMKAWVFGACNNPDRMSKEILSRFLLRRFNTYTEDEYLEVSVNVLREREGISDDLALHIARKVMRDLASKDVRDSVKIARLLKEKTRAEVDHIIGILSK